MCRVCSSFQHLTFCLISLYLTLTVPCLYLFLSSRPGKPACLLSPTLRLPDRLSACVARKSGFTCCHDIDTLISKKCAEISGVPCSYYYYDVLPNIMNCYCRFLSDDCSFLNYKVNVSLLSERCAIFIFRAVALLLMLQQKRTDLKGSISILSITFLWDDSLVLPLQIQCKIMLVTKTTFLKFNWVSYVDGLAALRR